jgi:solute carrier family 25 (mitochondrial iron transporter), member 28/37
MQSAGPRPWPWPLRSAVPQRRRLRLLGGHAMVMELPLLPPVPSPPPASLVGATPTGGPAALSTGAILAASALAGLTTRLVTHPLDTAKTWRQAGTPPAGVRALYRGLGVACALHAPALAVYLATYEGVKAALLRRPWGAPAAASIPREQATAIYAASALCAEAVSGLLWTPLEVLKQRVQVGVRPSARAAARSVVSTEGWRGLLRGYPLSLAVFMPYSVVFFVLYEHLTIAWLQRREPGTDPPVVVAVACGALAGAVAGATVNPLDVVKTRWQIVAAHAAPQSPWALARALYATEGARAFARGAVARALWTAPSVAIGMGSFELYKAWLRDRGAAGGV